MEDVLHGLLELQGVNAAIVLDQAGSVLGQLGRSLYEPALLEQISVTLAKAFDSISLQHEDWELISGHFSDGKLLARNVGPVPDRGHCLLVLIADGSLNPAFATVALRVAVNKLKRPVEAPGYVSASSPRLVAPSYSAPGASGVRGVPSAPPSARPPPPSARPPPPPSVRPPPPSAPWTTPPPLTSSSSSGLLAVTSSLDPASADLLKRCVKELARQVGPMAKLFVEEALQQVCGGGPFTLALANTLIEEVARHVEDPAGRAAFTSAVRQPRSK